MFLVKGSIRCHKPLKCAVCILSSNRLHKNLSLSSRLTDSVENEEPTFGFLSSDPKSEFYEKKKMFDASFTRNSFYASKEQKLFKESQAASDSLSVIDETRKVYKYSPKNSKFKTPLVSESNEQDNDDKTPDVDPHEIVKLEEAHLKWRSFKNSESEMHNHSQNMRRNNDKECLDSTAIATSSQESSKECFGTLSPPIDLYENESGDEGDKMQAKYEDAQLHRRNTPAYYGFKMKRLCKERRLADALKILEEEMPSVFVKPDRFCYQVLINACGRAGYTIKAFSLYNQMKKRGLKPLAVTYTGLFNSCANSPWPTTDGLRRAQKLRKQLQEKQYFPNQITSHAMIKAFGRCGDMKTTFCIVDEMLDQGLIVNAETINFMLQSCISDQAAGFRHALMVWRKMRELRIRPDIYTYNLLVRCISDCKAGHPELTSQLLEDTLHSQEGFRNIRKKDENKKIDICESLVETKVLKSNKKQNEESESIIDGNKEALDSSETLASVIEVISKDDSALCSSGNSEISALPDLLGRKLSIGSAIGLSSLEQPEDRLALVGGPAGLLAQMMKDKVTPDLKIVTQLLTSLPPNREVEESLMQSMKNVKLKPDTRFCNMLIRKRCLRGDSSAAKDVMDLMGEYALSPDIITFGCFALGVKSVASATEFFKFMDDRGFRPNIEIITILVKNSVFAKNYYYSRQLLRVMKYRSITPDKNILSWLEKARTDARTFLLNMENSKRDPTDKEKKVVDYINMFLDEYDNWLKKSDVQPDEHPWTQFRYDKANA